MTKNLRCNLLHVFNIYILVLVVGCSSPTSGNAISPVSTDTVSLRTVADSPYEFNGRQLRITGYLARGLNSLLYASMEDARLRNPHSVIFVDSGGEAEDLYGCFENTVTVLGDLHISFDRPSLVLYADEIRISTASSEIVCWSR